ncbi:MAG: MgtC/SapB family protein [Oscillospiraceae bacterium]|nr:MgtC/SapB family protein [Oscillospiraceae bacterium]
MGELLLRIVVAGFCGILIGLERTKRLKEAGIRTHFLVACSSAAIMLVSKYGFADLALSAFPGTGSADGARLAAQVVSGIGFLGAGMIFRGDAKVSGLTTAAGLWATAGIGLTVGAGLYVPAIFCTLLILLVQALTHRLSFRKDTLVVRTLTVHASIGPDFRETIAQLLEQNHWNIRGDNIKKSSDGTYTYTFRLRSDRGDSCEELLRHLENEENILSYTLTTSE